MLLLIHFYYGPLVEYQRLFDDAFSVRCWLSFAQGRCAVLPHILDTPIRSVHGKCTHDSVLSYICSVSSLLQNGRARIQGFPYHNGNIRSAWPQALGCRYSATRELPNGVERA